MDGRYHSVYNRLYSAYIIKLSKMTLSLLKLNGMNYYDVGGLRMTANSIRALLFADELEQHKINYSAQDFRIIELSKRKLIDTLVIDGKVITYITIRGKKKIEYLKKLGITRY